MFPQGDQALPVRLSLGGGSAWRSTTIISDFRPSLSCPRGPPFWKRVAHACGYLSAAGKGVCYLWVVKMTPAGLEPAIPGSVGRCLIHWATGPDVRCLRGAPNALFVKSKFHFSEIDVNSCADCRKRPRADLNRDRWIQNPEC